MRSLTRHLAQGIARLTFTPPTRSYASVLPDVSTAYSAQHPPPPHKNHFFNSVRSPLSSNPSSADTVDGWSTSLPSLDARVVEHLSGLRENSWQVRCTIIGSTGEVLERPAGPRALRKSHLCAEFGLRFRDLRKIDATAHSHVQDGQLPSILVRDRCFVINMLGLRALVTSDKVLLFGSATSSGLEDTFIKSLKRNLRQANCATTLPYEHRALETILATVSHILSDDLASIKGRVESLLEDLETDIVPSKLRLLLSYTRKVKALHQRSESIQEAIDEVLEQDDDLDGLHLSAPRSAVSMSSASATTLPDHSEVEMLLESFSKQVEEVVTEVEALSANVAQTKEVIELILDSSRNALMALELRTQICTVGLASGALVAGVFGMNLSTQLEVHPNAFGLVAGGAAALSVLVVAFGFKRMRVLRKVGLGPKRQPSWQHSRKEQHSLP